MQKRSTINPVLRNAPLGERLKQMASVLTDSGIGIGMLTRSALGGLAGALVEKEEDQRLGAAIGGAAMGAVLPTAAKGLISIIKDPMREDIGAVALGGSLGALTQDDTRRAGGAAFGTTMALALKGLMKKSQQDIHDYYEGSWLDEQLEKEAGWESAVHRLAGSKPLRWAGKALEGTANVLGAGGTGGAIVRGGVGAGIGVATADSEATTGQKLVRGGIGGALGVMAPEIVRDVKRVGQNLTSAVANPAKHFREGWRGHSPVGNLARGAKATEVQGRMIDTTKGSLQAARDKAKEPGWLSKIWHGGEQQAVKARVNKVNRKYDHLIDGQGNARNIGNWGPDAGKNRIQGVADELSRRGWTGSGTGEYLGGSTKYLPVGPKSLAVGFGAPAALGAVEAARGEKDWSEVAGDVGGTLMYAGAPATKGLGLLGSVGASSAGKAVASAPVRAVENIVRAQRGQEQKPYVDPPRVRPLEMAQAIHSSNRAQLGADTGVPY